MQGQVKQIIVSYKDRLVRFGSELLQEVCRWKNVPLVVLHDPATKSFETQLVEDVLAILTVYSSKIYGKRSHQKVRLSV